MFVAIMFGDLFKSGYICRYVYGEPVKGEVTVSVNPNIYSGVLQPFLNPVYKIVPINGKAVVEFDIVKDLRYVTTNHL